MVTVTDIPIPLTTRWYIEKSLTAFRDTQCFARFSGDDGGSVSSDIRLSASISIHQEKSAQCINKALCTVRKLQSVSVLRQPKAHVLHQFPTNIQAVGRKWKWWHTIRISKEESRIDSNQHITGLNFMVKSCSTMLICL